MLVFAASLTLYVATLAPGLLWGGGDFARFQTWAYLGHIEGKVDILAHPLWVYAAHPFTLLPIRDPAWRANFASAVFAATALVFVFLSCGCLTRSRPAAFLATAALAVSHTFWTYAVMPKVYSLNALLLALCIYLLLRWRATRHVVWLALFAFLYGLSFLNHLVMVTAAAGFAALIGTTLWMDRHESGRLWVGALAVLCFGLGLLPYLYLVVQSGAGPGTGAAVTSFLQALPRAIVQPMTLLKGGFWGTVLCVYQFPATALVGLLGVYCLWQRDRAVAVALSLMMLGTTAFLLGALAKGTGAHYVRDSLHYYLQADVPFSVALAAGFDVVWNDWCRHRRVRQAAVVALTLLPVPLYAAVPIIARRVSPDIPDFRAVPGRDNFAYVLSPWKQNESGARRYGEALLDAVPDDAVLFADYGPWCVVRYLQIVERARPRVKLVRVERIGLQVPQLLEYRAQPDLFLADANSYYDLDGIRRHFDVVPAGPIYRLVPKSAAPPG